jgi:hypothetical protein
MFIGLLLLLVGAGLIVWALRGFNNSKGGNQFGLSSGSA